MISDEAVFVDSAHLIALCIVDDQWREAATRAARSADRRLKVTSVGVFQEVLAHVSRGRAEVRSDAVRLVRAAQADVRMTVVEHDLRLIDEALTLYDGEFRHTSLSLQDCIAIQIMRDFGMTDILTADQEFALAGMTPLLRRYA